MSTGLKKLDARSRKALAAGKHKGRIDALVRLAQPPSDADRTALERLGCSVTATAGAAVSITIDASRMEDLAALDFVRSIEMARPLRAEQ